jgi:hypothetical protein
VKIIHIAALVLLTCTAAQAEIRTFGQSATTRIENVGTLTQAQRDGMEKFTRSAPYYGAIFIEKDGTGWGSFTGAHRMEDAIDIARRICARYAQDSSCVLAGVTYPEDYQKTAADAETLSPRASEKYAIYQSRTEGYRAFAVSGNTAFGWSTRRETAGLAAEAALKYCWTGSMKNLLELEVDLRKAAIEDGYYSCRIIDRAGPPPS